MTASGIPREVSPVETKDAVIAVGLYESLSSAPEAQITKFQL